MATIELKQIDAKDPQLQQVQRNVADAVEALSNQKVPALGVLRVSSNQKLVGNEDVVLVDASTATTDVTLILPSVKALQRLLRVKVVRASSTYAVVIKAVDIASTSSPTIDGVASVSIPAKSNGSVEIVSDGKNFSTL